VAAEVPANYKQPTVRLLEHKMVEVVVAEVTIKIIHQVQWIHLHQAHQAKAMQVVLVTQAVHTQVVVVAVLAVQAQPQMLLKQVLEVLV
jgi:hypothetical protein